MRKTSAHHILLEWAEVTGTGTSIRSSVKVLVLWVCLACLSVALLVGCAPMTSHEEDEEEEARVKAFPLDANKASVYVVSKKLVT